VRPLPPLPPPPPPPRQKPRPAPPRPHPVRSLRPPSPAHRLRPRRPVMAPAPVLPAPPMPPAPLVVSVPAPLVAPPPAPPRSQQITQPEWISKPSGADLARYYPQRAQRLGIEGEAVIGCTVDRSGRLAACSVMRRSPARHGFGAAALKMSVPHAPDDPRWNAGGGGQGRHSDTFRPTPLLRRGEARSPRASRSLVLAVIAARAMSGFGDGKADLKRCGRPSEVWSRQWSEFGPKTDIFTSLSS